MLYIILALLFYTAAIIIGAIASRNADTNLVTAIVNIVSVIIPVSVVIPTLSQKSIFQSKYGILMAIIGGIMIALFSMALNKSFTLNKVGIVAPIVFGGSIFLSSLISFFLFKEKISVVQGLGLACMGVGLVVIVYSQYKGV